MKFKRHTKKQVIDFAKKSPPTGDYAFAERSGGYTVSAPEAEIVTANGNPVRTPSKYYLDYYKELCPHQENWVYEQLAEEREKLDWELIDQAAQFHKEIAQRQDVVRANREMDLKERDQLRAELATEREKVRVLCEALMSLTAEQGSNAERPICRDWWQAAMDKARAAIDAARKEAK